MLDELLQYHEPPLADDFTDRVLRAARRRQRLRRLILWGSGAVGAVFGAAGMLLLSDPLAALMQGDRALPVSLGVVLAAGALAWLLQDEAASAG
jgi:hypothetical protein